GGPGKDVFAIGDGSDFIYNFADGSDKFLLPSGVTFEDLTIETIKNTRSSSVTSISISGDDTIANLYFEDSSLLTSDDFSLS
ncbi:MAG: hypothetical protein ACRC1Z_00130, partial [Waterburya sp.]